MRPTTAHDDNIFDLNYLLHPGTAFEHPRDVVSNPSLSLAQKRAILASWASDASAIASCPSLRAPEGLKAPVAIDEILEALCARSMRDRGIRLAASRCGSDRSNAPRPELGVLQTVPNTMPFHVYTRSSGGGAVSIIVETAREALAKAAEILEDGHRK
jgi:hypothetical protein